MSRRGHTETTTVLGGGRGGSKVPGWLKWSGAGLTLALAALTSNGWGAFAFLVIFGGIVVVDCVAHPLNILRYLAAMVLIVGSLLSNRVVGPPMKGTSESVASTGDLSVSELERWWNENRHTVSNDPPPTTAPPTPAGP